MEELANDLLIFKLKEIRVSCVPIPRIVSISLRPDVSHNEYVDESEIVVVGPLVLLTIIGRLAIKHVSELQHGCFYRKGSGCFTF